MLFKRQFPKWMACSCHPGIPAYNSDNRCSPSIRLREGAVPETVSGGDPFSSEEALDFEIEVISQGATEEELDRMTRNLLFELRETDVESAELVSVGAAPEGSKGDPITLGTLAMTVMPAVLPMVIEMVKDWTGRREGRTVKFKGKGIEFEGSPEELQKLLETLKAKRLPRESAAGRKTKENATGAKAAPLRKKPARSPRVFISYRRAESADVTGRIYDRLTRHFGPAAIFKDVESIPLGIDFKEHLEKAVAKCRIFLVVIGNQWLEAGDSLGNNRLEDPRDFVRIELEAALHRNIPVIPLLVRGGSMPAEEKLPPSLRTLVYRNAISIRPDPDFHRDMDRLIEAISDYASRKS